MAATEPARVAAGSVLDLAPELGAGIPSDDREAARQACRGELVRVAPGRLELAPGALDGDPWMALVIVSGVMCREVRLCDRHLLELLGAGDALQLPVEVEDRRLATDVTLTAVAAPGHTFVGWSGAGCGGTGLCRVTLSGNVTIAARFTAFTVRIQKVGTGAGVVTSAPAGIVCGDDCSETYTRGTRLTLTPVPDPGSTFVGWSGAGCSGTKPCTLTVNGNAVVSGRFARH